MRIIRVLVVASIFWFIFSQNKAMAMNLEEANETKINLKNDEKSSLINVLSYNDLDSWVIDQGNSDKIVIDDLDDIQRDKILAKFMDKAGDIDLPDGQFEINASAYTAAADECGKSDGIAASGILVKEQRTLACPKEFPLGTKINIDGYGVFVCEDRGGAIKGNHFDIYMKTKKEAFAFGRKNLVAEVIL